MQGVSANNLTFGPEITWPKEFPELKAIDNSLRCGICYDYLKTAMVTPCAHSYCSICIRKFLSYKTACPTCFEETFETSLRNNRILDRVVELFSLIRDKLIKHLKIAAIHFNCSEKSVSSSTLSSQNSTSQKTSLPSETPKNSSKKIVPKAASSKGKLNFSSLSSPSASTSSRKSEISKRLEDILGSPVTNGATSSNDLGSVLPASVEDCELNISTVPSMFLKDPQPKHVQPRTDVPLVSCPVCGVDIPERNINTHLDNCLSNVDKPVKSPKKKTPKRTPLPKMVWTMMSDKELRKKLKELGLYTTGDKRALISRIQRYIVLYNSECDSENPRSVSDIIRQVEREEKQMPTVQTQQRLVLTKKSDPKIIEEENKKYIQENKDCFNKLIEAMREREGRNIRPLRPINRLSSDEEDENILEKEKENEETKSSTSKDPPETVNLCDSRSSSPVLDQWVSEPRTPSNGLPSNPLLQDDNVSEDLSSEDIFLHETRHKANATPDRNEFLFDNIRGSASKSDAQSELCDAEALFHSSPSRPPSPSIRGSASKSDAQSELCDAEALFHSSPSRPPSPSIRGSASKSDAQSELCDAEALFHSSPSRPPSPSCIITAHSESDSDDSVSILMNQNIDDEATDNIEPNTEIANAGASQLCDPDFCLDTEYQEEELREERVFHLRKRKQNAVHEIPSPRRTRRRINK